MKSKMKLGTAIDRVRKNIEKLGLARSPECYSVSEAVYHLAGGKAAGLKAMRIKQSSGECHWFLKGPHGELIDLTAGQFECMAGWYLPQYESATGAAFYPNLSNLAKELMK